MSHSRVKCPVCGHITSVASVGPLSETPAITHLVRTTTSHMVCLVVKKTEYNGCVSSPITEKLSTVSWPREKHDGLSKIILLSKNNLVMYLESFSSSHPGQGQLLYVR